MIDYGRRNVLGLPIRALDYESAVRAIVQAASQQRPFSVSALAVHGVMTGVLDREHGYRLSQFDLLVPDGQPVRWALRWLHGVRLADRVYGPTLMLKTCEAASTAKLPIFLFGSTDRTLHLLEQNLVQRFPDLIVAGRRASQFRRIDADEKKDLVADIRESGARICFCGLGCPRQEVWAFEFREALSMPILAVGAAFDFHAGILQQAPAILQRYGLEWAFRLVAEPRRLWRRYLYLNPLYLALVAFQRTGLKKADATTYPRPTEELSYG